MPFVDQSNIPKENRTLKFKVRSTQEDKVPCDLFTLCHFLVYRYENPPREDPELDTYNSVYTVPDQFTYTVLSGGITNRLFSCSLPGQPTVLVRLFGPHTDAVIDRKKELRVAKFISRHGVGPAVLGTFLNGRMEGYIPETQALTPNLMLNRSISASVAKAVAALHSLPFNPDHDTESASKQSTPLNALHLSVTGDSVRLENPSSNYSLPSNSSTASTHRGSVGMMSEASTTCSAEFATVLASSSARPHPRGLWDTILNWLSLGLGAREHFVAQAKQTGSNVRLELYDSLQLPRIDRELVELRALLEQLEEPIVFCHNDLLSGNILLDMRPSSQEKISQDSPVDASSSASGADSCCTSTACSVINRDPSDDSLPGITIIDYEYGSVNYRAFDIANHFCECCGFNCDWTQFPNLDHQRNFIRTYLRAMRRNATLETPSSVLLSPVPGQVNICEADLDPTNEPEEVFEARVEVLRRRVMGFALASHLFWGSWAVVMALSTRVSFDYLGYSALRLKGYFFMKSRCLAEVKPVLEAKLTSSLTFPSGSPTKPLNYGFVGWGMGSRDLHAPTIARSFGGRLRGVFATSFQFETELAFQARESAEKLLLELNNQFSITGCRVPLQYETVEEAYVAALAESSFDLSSPSGDMSVEFIQQQAFDEIVTSVGVDWDGTHYPSAQATNETKFSSKVHAITTTAYRSYQELLQDPLVDVVLISTPPQTHFSLAVKALRAGKHVIIDKPFVAPSATTPNALRLTRTLFHIAEQNGRRLACIQNRRYDGDFLTADALMHGSLPGDTSHANAGDVKWAELAFQKGVTTKAWKCVPLSLGGGRLWDLGVHLLDQALLLFRHSPPTQVYAKALFLLPPEATSHYDAYSSSGIERKTDDLHELSQIETEAESHATVTVSFKDGSVAVLDTGSLVAPGAEKPRFLLVGSRATFVKHGQDPQEEALLDNKPPSAAVEDATQWGTIFSRTRNSAGHFHPTTKIPTLTGRWATFYEEFFKHVHDSSFPSPVSRRDSELLMAVFDTILKSIRSGHTESIPLIASAKSVLSNTNLNPSTDVFVEYGKAGATSSLDVSLFSARDSDILSEEEIQLELDLGPQVGAVTV